MPISVSKYLPCYKGATKIIDFDECPICKYCNNPMKIVNTSIVGPIVRLTENYNVQKRYYQCGRVLCKGEKKSPSSQKI